MKGLNELPQLMNFCVMEQMLPTSFDKGSKGQPAESLWREQSCGVLFNNFVSYLENVTKVC